MCSCEVKTFTFDLSACDVKSFAFSWGLSAGLNIKVLHQGTDYIEVSLSANQTSMEGYASIMIEWCDANGGHGSRNVSCHVTPGSTITPSNTVTVTPSATPSSAPVCGPGGPLSTCYPIGVSYFNATVGQDYNLSISLSCPYQWVRYDWAITTSVCTIVVNNSHNQALYSIQCSGLTAKARGIIQTKWCDQQGGYVSFTTNFDIYPRSPVATATVAPVPATGVDKCRLQGKPSSCQILGPAYVSVPAGQSFVFAVTLQCPVQSCQSHWTATFGSCLVTVNYRSVNPVYTIKAPLGSEGRGGYILTEWCDEYAGYMNWTTNFVVTGTGSNATYQAAAEVGVLAQGESESAASATDSGSTDWRHTGWIIACFVLLAVFGTLFLLAVGRLLLCRSKPRYASGQGRGEPAPQSADFASPTPMDTVPGETTTIHPRSPNTGSLDP